jgi:DNA-binding NtrC family response regulator
VRELLDRCRQAAATRYPVLITGETGTGKEILAGAIHSTAFPSGSAPYVKINCTAIPDNLLESELFGHEKGAFTGAVTAKKGKFELAGGGSILLDEIGEMDLRMQSKLLRVLEEREFERLGGSRMQVMNTRVMASTNADLHALADRGRFRADLYYRLSTIEIRVPPLRERVSDIPLLVEHFVQRESLSVRFSPEALEQLQTYRWPGNVRQLRNTVLRLGIGAAGETLGADQVRAALPQESVPADPAVPAASPRPAPSTMEEAERQAILDALASCGGNQSQAAQRLGVGRTTLYRKMKKYGISPRGGMEFDDGI